VGVGECVPAWDGYWFQTKSAKNRIELTMKTKLTLAVATIVACAFGAASVLQADDLEKAKNVEKNIRQAEPPKVSTETKKSPVGVPAREFRPVQKPLVIKEPPSPVVTRSTSTAVSTSTGTAKSSSTAAPKN
jgi:hypothetical protein